MTTHNKHNNFDPWQNGYDDAMYDGIDTSSEMPCKCDECRKKYYEGQEAAFKEVFGKKDEVEITAEDEAPFFQEEHR